MLKDNSTQLVDRAVLAAMVEDFDPDIMRLLLETAQTDIEKWSEQLIQSWEGSDEELRRQARHSLKGLCSNFGAHTLLQMTEIDLSDPSEIEHIRTCRAETFAELRQAFEELS